VVGGDRILIRGGVYRGKITFTNNSGSAGFPIQVTAYSNELPVLKGSVLKEGWIPYGNGVWYITNHTLNCQQVFSDGVVLQQRGWPNEYVSTRACSCADWLYIPYGFSCADINPVTRNLDIGNPVTNLPPGSFYYEKSSQMLYVRLPDSDDPNLHEMEVSTELGIFYDESSAGFLHLKGLAFRHANTFTYTFEGWPGVLIGVNGIIENCDIQWCDASGLTLKSNSKALGCNISNNGMLGVACNNYTNMLVKGCIVTNNNYREFAESYSGGIRFIPSAGATVEDNEVAHNYSTGIWFDTCAAGHPLIVRNNYVHHNWLQPRRVGDTSTFSSQGIFIEFSSNAQVYNNLVISNGNIGIHLSASRDCRIEHNLITGTRSIPGGHRALYSLAVENPQPGYNVYSNRVANNLIAYNSTDYDVFLIVSNGITVFGNEFDNNLYYRPSGAGSAFPSSPVAMAYLGKGIYNTIQGWRDATGWDSSSLTNNPLFLTNYSIGTASPAVDRGMNTQLLPMDFLNLPRPMDGNSDGLARPDIGPFEVQSTGNVFYVNITSTNPVPPYSSVATAANHPADVLSIATTGSTIVVHDGLYPISSTLILEDGIAMRSVNGADLTIFDAASNTACVMMNSTGTVLHGFTLRNGHSTGDGGGIWMGPGSLLQNCIVRDCHSDQNGGGVYIAPGGFIRNCSILNNTAEVGGGVYAGNGVVLDQIYVRDNQSEQDGGGIYAGLKCKVNGGSYFSNQSLLGKGGGLYLDSGSDIVDSLVVSNSALLGGGIYASNSNTIRNTLIMFNQAGTGGGVYDQNSAWITLSRILDNQSLNGPGGGFYSEKRSLVQNSLMVGNSAQTEGGGFYLGDDSSIEFCTVSGNNSVSGGGGVFTDSTGVSIRNCILWANTSADHPNWIFAEDSQIEHVCTFPPPPGTNVLSTDPLFRNSPVRDFRLRAGSPCIDAGFTIASVTNDLDYKSRNADGNADRLVRPDLGAYEFHGIRYVDVNSPVQSDPYLSWNTASRTLQAAINAATSGDLILVATGVYSIASTVNVSKQVTLRSVAGPATTILDGNNTTRILSIGHSGALVEGFTIQRGRSDSGAGAYIANGKLSRCILRGNVATGNLGGNFVYVPSPPRYYCQISYDTVIHEGGGGLALLNGGTAENCLIISNTAAYGGGVLSLNGGILNHVTVSENRGTNNGGGLFAKNATSIRNSILYGNTAGGNYTVTGTNPLWQSVSSLPLPPGEMPLDDDPLFVSPANGNFQLAQHSSSIDSASPLTASTYDLISTPRPLDGDADGTPMPDRGAYEYIHPTADSDQDGLHDAVEINAGTSPLASDTDGDRSYDGEEVFAGTNPLDATDYLYVMQFVELGNELELHWPGKSGRTYTVHHSTNLLQGFTPYMTNVTAGFSHVEGIGNATNYSTYYRLEVHYP